uniref:Putative aarF domain-containing protein kinase 1 n=2 Tax=Anthurium amnicola TaxID=1678845 RepID=A0A1D1XV04_9ARAE
MGWGSIYRRRLKVFSLALVIYLDYKAVQKRVKWFGKSRKAGIWDKTHERNAKRLLNLMIELEGLWVKLGQYLSTRADVLPEAYIFLLKQLQDSLPPRPLNEVKRTIEKELGKPVDDLFSNFVDVPLATASIAQVHRATLRNGQEVVVKVQHESIKQVILEDLKNAKSIIDWIAWAEPQYNFNPLIDEWCKEAPKELDFNIEAENTRTVSKNLRNTNKDGTVTQNNHVDVLIPEVIQSSERVLVLEFMDGIRLNDYESLEAFGINKQKLVEEITRAYAHQIYIDGFFNGDPHPGNFLVSKEPPHHPILLDFGLTKSISSSMKQALAKMFLASAEGDHVALLSAFAEMGLKLRLDIPEQVMEVTNVIFRATTPAKEALENMKALADQRTKNMKVIQEKMKLNKKEMSRFNPVDAFPGDAVIFFRVINLLRGLSSSLNVRIVYQEIMRPFAESTLQGVIGDGSLGNTQWIHDSHVHSDVEAKLRKLLVELGKDKILGIQVCAYKGGEVIIDTAAGVLGRYDPRPVELDSLFPVFSATKGLTAGMLHWLVDKGKLSFEESVATIWPDFGTNAKEQIKVHHVLNHTSGLHNAMADAMKVNPFLMCEWDESLKQMCMSIPESEPGSQQQYHYLSFGWLCGGIIEHASGKKFQEVLDEAIVQPLNVQGELYIGIPPGVESRLATLTLDMDDLNKFSVISIRPEIPDSLRRGNLVEMASGLPVLFNTLNARRAIIPAANGHCSARALARYYAALAAGGIVPPSHSSYSTPLLGSHPHIPKFPTLEKHKKKYSKGKESAELDSNKFSNENTRSSGPSNGHHENGANGSHLDKNGGYQASTKVFTNPKIHDACMGLGDYSHLVFPDGKFGLGFRRFDTIEGRVTTFGHSGVGGSTGFCDIEDDFAIAVTVNKMSLGGVTRSIIQLVCSELNIPLPQEFSAMGERGPDMQLNLGPQLNS